MEKKVEIVCDWPSSKLSPNARVHWAQKAKMAKIYRNHAYLMARQELICVKDCEPDLYHALSDARKRESSLSVLICFYPPDNRYRDKDNMIGAFKSGQDGIADALLINDRRFDTTHKVSLSVKGGKVVFTIQFD